MAAAKQGMFLLSLLQGGDCKAPVLLLTPQDTENNTVTQRFQSLKEYTLCGPNIILTRCGQVILILSG